ncbi:MAG: exonuclease SbcCD subunit D C-terminal domain-containing protein [Rikenellaceae bacterium]
MRLLHTADWHLGQTFYEYERKQEHGLFLAWLREQVKEHEIDLLLISGDVFDTQNPSADAQKMYYTFLRDITAENPNLQIVIIAGNHDSAARLEAPNPLLEAMNVTVRGVVRRNIEGEIDYDNLIIPLDKGGVCLAVPYLRQGDYPGSSTYAEGVQRLYSELITRAKNQDFSPIVAMGHLQATGSEISERDKSERTIIGGLEAISPEAFDGGVCYTALGHLHRAQRVSGRENVRYSGAPLPMSFAEKNNKQGVTLVTIGENTEIERLVFEAPVKLLTVPSEPKPLKEVLAAIAELPDGEIDNTSPFLEVKVAISEPEPTLRRDIEAALETKAVRLARLEAVIQKSSDEQRKIMTYEELQEIDPLYIATDIFKRKFGGDDMPQNMKTMLNSVIEEVQQ